MLFQASFLFALLWVTFEIRETSDMRNELK